MYLVFSIFSIIFTFSHGQQVDIQPLLALLRPENMRSVAELATELGSMAAKNVANNERDVQKTSNYPKPDVDFKPDARPSQMIGGAISSLVGTGRNAFLDALDKLEESTKPTAPITFAPPPTLPSSTTINNNVFGIRTSTEPSEVISEQSDGSRDVLGARSFAAGATGPREIRYAEVVRALPAAAPQIGSESSTGADPLPLARPPSPQNPFDGSPFMKIARQFLGGPAATDAAPGGQSKIPQIGIRDFVSGSDSNFGLPRGKGCLPFISEFMQIAYGDCQNVADEKTFDTWADELRRAILTGEIDVLKASQETCRRGAERQQCDALRNAVANCDVLASIEIGSQLQRNMKRCEEVSGMMDQSPAAVLGQLNNLINGEVAQGFLNNFLKNG